MIVKVVDYNPNWPRAFEEEAGKIQATLGDIVHQIHHMGSTAVPGLSAKPVIDILLDVTDLNQLEADSTKMENLGYEVMGAYGIPGRLYFRKGGEQRTHHVHAYQSGDDHLVRHLAFRDYLRANKAVAEAYGKLKIDIVKRGGLDIEQYCDAKDPFIKHHEAKALLWYGKG